MTSLHSLWRGLHTFRVILFLLLSNLIFGDQKADDVAGRAIVDTCDGSGEDVELAHVYQLFQLPPRPKTLADGKASDLKACRLRLILKDDVTLDDDSGLPELLQEIFAVVTRDVPIQRFALVTIHDTLTGMR